MKQSIMVLTMLLSVQVVHPQLGEPPVVERAHDVVHYLVDTVERVPGVIVASKVAGAKWRFDSKGVTEYASTKNVDADTIFEIGSVTKVFTSVLLADMVQRGEVRLDESILDYLPAAAWPEPIGRITFLHLATHTSGLKRRPDNLKSEDGRGPYADYDETDLLKYLETAELLFMPGESATYSNLGVGLLGVLLAGAAETSFEELLRSRIFEPLGMVSTTIQTRAHHNIATPHDITGSRTTGFWSFDALAGAGGIRSTARDMARFVDSLLGLRESPIALASRSALNEYTPSPAVIWRTTWPGISQTSSTIMRFSAMTAAPGVHAV